MCRAAPQQPQQTHPRGDVHPYAWHVSESFRSRQYRASTKNGSHLQLLTLGLGDDGLEFLSSVRHFHDRHPAPSPIQKLVLSPLQDVNRQARRACTEIPHASIRLVCDSSNYNSSAFSLHGSMHQIRVVHPCGDECEKKTMHQTTPVVSRAVRQH